MHAYEDLGLLGDIVIDKIDAKLFVVVYDTNLEVNEMFAEGAHLCIVNNKEYEDYEESDQ